jgi:hypothetical protein
MLVLSLCLGASLPAQVIPPTPVAPPISQPIPWQQRTLFIPYQLNTQIPATRDVSQVQLLVSRTGANDWSVLQSAEPNVQGFNYHAPEDGHYWFALKHLDAKGQALDGPVIAPQLHLVIDTQSGPVIPSPTNPPPPTELPAPEIESNSLAQQPNAAGGRSPFASGDPFQTAAKPAQDWPASNQVPTVNQNMSPVVDAPPIINPYTTAGEANPRRTPAMFAVDGTKGSDGVSKGFAANLLDAQSAPKQELAELPAAEESDWSSAGRQEGPLVVNARTFDVEYDLQAVGSWGVAKVELWGTQDEGATWQSFGVDADNRSPIRVTVPESGTFGFRILVEGANSIGAPPPQSGDKPELVVMVDLEQPKAEIVAIEPAAGNLADQLRLCWTAEDTNLESRPISLFYSSYAEGPWSTIAAGLENTGVYVWRIERHIPGRFFLRLEARDTAGNVTTYQTPEPIELNRPQPTGTLRSVRPVTDVPVVGR